MLIILSGCSYGHKQYDPSATNGQPASDGLLAIEVADYGRFWDPDAGNRLYKYIKKESAGKNLVLITFIHGWHHNADVADDHRIAFQKTVLKLQEKVSTSEYAESRAALSLQRQVKVIGLYVGWRGRSLPCVLDYLTFWGRKAAAERVGGGDLRELLLRLHNLYEERNSPVIDTFMGMVTIGHSFGGQIALRTVAELLERELLDGKSRPEGVRGLGDVTVLLNPAVEAHQYERIHRLAKEDRKFAGTQSPVLLTVSANNDWARNWPFRFGRMVSRLFRASFPTDGEAQQWTQALGMYTPQHTHLLKITNRTDTIREGVDSKELDFSRDHVIAHVALNLIPDRSTANYPFIVASTPDEVLIDGHNGIFSDTLREFLAEFVALSQGKRICLRREAVTSSPKCSSHKVVDVGLF